MTWEVGDLAMRIPDEEGERYPDECSPTVAKIITPKIGSISRVNYIETKTRWVKRDGFVYLGFEGVPSDLVIDSRLFVKVVEGKASHEEVIEAPVKRKVSA